MTLPKHGGGRPRGPNSVLNVVERWGISEKTARRLIAMNLNDDAMAVMVRDSQRLSAAQKQYRRRKYAGGMRGLGMRSRVPGLVRSGPVGTP